MVRMCGGIPVIVETTAENGWKLTAEQFEEAMTPRTKMVILTTPNNPTGSVYSEEELRALGEVALSEDILILADEITNTSYTGTPSTSASPPSVRNCTT